MTNTQALVLVKLNAILSQLDLPYTLQHVWEHVYEVKMDDETFTQILLDGIKSLPEDHRLFPNFTDKEVINGVIKELRQQGFSPLSHYVRGYLTAQSVI